jgi:hypothetical protein
MTNSDFTIRTINRGEQACYADGDVQLTFEQTWCDGHRIMCSSITADSSGALLTFLKRKQIIQNCCRYFDTAESKVIFVIDEADPDRTELESLIERQKALGHHIAIEYDSEERRQQRHDQMMMDLLKAGKTVSFNGITYTTVEEYLGRKEKS